MSIHCWPAMLLHWFRAFAIVLLAVMLPVHASMAADDGAVAAGKETPAPGGSGSPVNPVVIK